MSKKFLTPIALPSGDQNPSVGTIGALFYRSDLSLLHIYTGSEWAPISGGSSSTSNIDGGIVGEESFIVGGQASTVSFARTADGGTPSTVSTTGSYDGGVA